jgi:hypothetical protein
MEFNEESSEKLTTLIDSLDDVKMLVNHVKQQFNGKIALIER